MEEENSVFGFDAGNADKLDSEEKFSFYHNDKEESESFADSSSKDLSDFVETLIQDVPDLSDEEIQCGIEKILERTHPDEGKTEKAKRGKKKVILKVLFIAALLSALSFSCLFAVGSKHNISIENGFFTFAKDTVKVVFYGETKEEFITVDALLTDLEYHGYKDILFPEEFAFNSDDYKFGVPEYSIGNGGLEDSVGIDVYGSTYSYSFSMLEGVDSSNPTHNFPDLEKGETVVIDDVYIYVFEFEGGTSVIWFINNGIKYTIDSEAPLSEMIRIANTIAKME